VNGTHTLAMWIMINERPDRKAAARLLQRVVLPRRLVDGLEATEHGALLEEQRHAVREADHARGLVGGQIAAEGDRRLDLERAAAVDRRPRGVDAA
jgi:hypothetical protein